MKVKIFNGDVRKVEQEVNELFNQDEFNELITMKQSYYFDNSSLPGKKTPDVVISIVYK